MKKRVVFGEQALTKSPSSSHHFSPQQVRFQEQAFAMGNIVGVNGYRTNRAELKHRLAQEGYQVHETAHFLVCIQEGTPTLVVHWFAPQAIDSELGHHFMEELKPLGLLVDPQSFGDVYGAVVNSVRPHDPQWAWHLFGTNTLDRFHQLLTTESCSPHYDSPIDVFATLYKRVCTLLVGDSFLDAGCSFGVLPLVVAERVRTLTKMVGVDIRTDPFPVTRAIAEERHLTNVQFVQADLLADNFSTIGQFDTVTMLHVLEHFTEVEMYQVLTHLLKITSRRLIIGVPYEPGEAETAYGHQQLFTQNKLEGVGKWCLEQWGGGCMQCEDCAGGLLVLDRPCS